PLGNVVVGADSTDKLRTARSLVLATRMDPGLVDKLQDGGKEGPANRIAGRLGFDSAQDALKAIRMAEAEGLRAYSLYEMGFQSIAASQGISYEESRKKFGSNPLGYMQAAFHSSSDFPLL